jgi:peptidoglycan/LPS O-acetylase OafA/YrhL
MTEKRPAGKTSSVKREIELDFVRGIAILLVLTFHYQRYDPLPLPGPVRVVMSFGWIGVDLFFVLSGFLVGGLVMKEWKATGGVEIGRFLKRRGFKIWPSYYIYLLVVTVFHVRPLREFFWQNFFNVQNYFESSLSHTWSLAVEEQFYLGMAALMALWTWRKWRPGTLLATCLVLAVAVEIERAVMAYIGGFLMYTYTHTRIDAMLLGVSLAAIRQFYPAWFQKLQSWWPLQLVLIALALVRLYIDSLPGWPPEYMQTPWLMTSVDYGCAALLLLLYRPRRVAGREDRPAHGWLYRMVARLGIFSYGVYLWHISVERPVDWSIAHSPRALAPVVSLLLPYALAVLLGVIATKAVELPALRLRERLVPSRIPEASIPTG